MPTSNPTPLGRHSADDPVVSSQQSTQRDRVRIDYLLHPTELAQAELEAAYDVIHGLKHTPKSLPPRYFYDDRGSDLFEQICDLPDYYLTRTETKILKQCAGAIAQQTGACEIVELGSGSATKTRILLDAYQTQNSPLSYMPVDVSAGILQTSAHQLLGDYPTLNVHGLVSTYQLALERLTPSSLPSRMICFIGSTLGNLSPDACDRFFDQISAALQPGEYFLLGIDLQKDRATLEAAYNDSQGITAAFNLNILRHLNRKFKGDFDLDQFEHWAFYNESLNQIEMHLRSRSAQTVHLETLDLTVSFEPGETILSEISRKFNVDTMQHKLATHSLSPIHTWTDDNQWFAVILCQAS